MRERGSIGRILFTGVLATLPITGCTILGSRGCYEHDPEWCEDEDGCDSAPDDDDAERCSSGEDCADTLGSPSQGCGVWQCVAGACEIAAAAGGVARGDLQASGDCSRLACDGVSLLPVAAADPYDLPTTGTLARSSRAAPRARR